MKFFLTLIRTILIAFACIFVGQFAQSQSLSIQSLAGFPDVIANGATYNIQAYIVNTGSVSFTVNPKVWISFNNGTPEKINGGWSPALTLAPGDSVLWFKNGHTFTSTSMVSGLNDILVWPEAPAVITLDSAAKTVDVGNYAMFRLGNHSISGTSGGSFFPKAFYDLELEAFNQGGNTNILPVRFWMQLDSDPPIFLDFYSGLVPTGDSCKIKLNGFHLNNFIIDHWNHNHHPQKLRFWAQELAEVPPLDSAVFSVETSVSVNPLANSIDWSVFPVPARDQLMVRHDFSPDAVVEMQLIGINGKVEGTYDGIFETLDVRQLSAGTYFLRLKFSSGESQTKKFLKY